MKERESAGLVYGAHIYFMFPQMNGIKMILEQIFKMRNHVTVKASKRALWLNESALIMADMDY